MTPHEQQNKVFDSKFVVVLKYQEILSMGLDLTTVIQALNNGIMLDQNLYEIREKTEIVRKLSEQVKYK